MIPASLARSPPSRRTWSTTVSSAGINSTAASMAWKGREGTFLMTTFWLADNLALMGRSR